MAILPLSIARVSNAAWEPVCVAEHRRHPAAVAAGRRRSCRPARRSTPAATIPCGGDVIMTVATDAEPEHTPTRQPHRRQEQLEGSRLDAGQRDYADPAGAEASRRPTCNSDVSQSPATPTAQVVQTHLQPGSRSGQHQLRRDVYLWRRQGQHRAVRRHQRRRTVRRLHHHLRTRSPNNTHLSRSRSAAPALRRAFTSQVQGTADLTPSVSANTRISRSGRHQRQWSVAGSNSNRQRDSSASWWISPTPTILAT